MTFLALLIRAALVLASPAATPPAHMDSPLTPEEALKTFQVDPGLRVELVACEPQVIDPVAIAFDEHYRLYVVEMRDYPADPGEPIGRVALLEDRDGDGRYETRHHFADGLVGPTGVCPWDGGVFVTCAPDVLYLRDTDGDGHSDERRVVLTGFSMGDSSQLRVNHPTLGLDGWIYLANGLSGGSIVAPQHPGSPLQLGRHDLRFHPRTLRMEPVAGFAQFGLTFDDFGRRYICSNRRHIDAVVFEPRDLQRHPHLPFGEVAADISDHGAACRVFPISQARTTAASHAGTITAACGICIYRGDALPREYYGNSFVCEPTGNLVHRDVLEPAGATPVARRADETREFLASPDEWFRPVNLANGPDGALYICDMYRRTIEHPRYLPEEVARITDFASGNDRGRIWRVVARNFRPAPRPALHDRPNHELAALLARPDAWTRETAHRLLLLRGREIAPAVRDVLHEDSSLAIVHALHLLAACDALRPDDLLALLPYPDAGVREVAVNMLRPHLQILYGTPDAPTPAALLALADDPSPRVRFALARALGDLLDPTNADALVKIARRDVRDRFTGTAVLSATYGWTTKFLGAFIQNLPDDPANHAFVYLAASTSAREAGPQGVIGLMRRMLPGAEHPTWQFALLHGFCDGLRVRKGPDLLALLAEDSDPVIRRGLARLLSMAEAFAGDVEADPTSRRSAIALLGRSPLSESRLALRRILVDDPTMAEDALRALLVRDEDTELDFLLNRETWRKVGHAVRQRIVSAVIARPRWADRALRAIEEGTIRATSVPPTRRDELLKHPDRAIRTRAEAVFRNLTGSDRHAAYEAARAALALPARPDAGRTVFTRLCAQCHRSEGQGFDVGPDLTGIRNQAPETILMHIVLPNAEINPLYPTTTIETVHGDVLTGIVIAETPSSVTIRRVGAQENTILRADIDSMYADPLSLMPEELEANMTAQELADLIAYLRGGPATAPSTSRE